MGKENSSRYLLLTLCSEEEMTITNTLLSIQRSTQPPGCTSGFKHWHLIDFIITRHCDISDILVTRAMTGADCWTNPVIFHYKALFRISSKHMKTVQQCKE